MDWRIHRFEEVDSTNETAFGALARGEGQPGDVFIASRQTAGRGTRGRPWLSERGGLYMSAILETPTLPVAGLWTIAGALAALDLAAALGVSARLDWPNDLVNGDGAKLGGILAESRGLRPGAPATYVLGIGVNLEARALEMPGAARALGGRPVAALLPAGNGGRHGASGSGPDPEAALLAALSERTTVAVEDPKALFQGFFGHCLQANQPVRVEIAGNAVCGVFVDLDPVRGVCLAPGPDALGGPRVPAARWLALAHVRSMVVSA